MNVLLFAQHVSRFSTWGFVEWIIALIIFGGVIAVAFVVAKTMGWTPPPWLIQIFVICAVVFVGIVAIRFLMSL